MALTHAESRNALLRGWLSSTSFAVAVGLVLVGTTLLVLVDVLTGAVVMAAGLGMLLWAAYAFGVEVWRRERPTDSPPHSNQPDGMPE